MNPSAIKEAWIKLAHGPLFVSIPEVSLRTISGGNWGFVRPEVAPDIFTESGLRTLDLLDPKWRSEGMVLYPDSGTSSPAELGPNWERVHRRHELSHYMDFKRGKKLRTGISPRALFNRTQGEIAATLAERKAYNRFMSPKILSNAVTYHSMGGNVANVWKTAFGNAFRKLLRRVR